MSKIATLTTHGADNYGAVLQAFALQQYLQRNGHACDILNYVPRYTIEDYRIVKRPSTLRDVALSLFQLMHYFERKERKRRFSNFRDTYLKLSGEVIREHEELIGAADQYDMIVCGSDQIWNPAIHDFDEAYFLSFPQVKTKKVSYAASFGQDHIADGIKNELMRRLVGFSSFACREHSALQLIRELTNRNADFVLDPVFLLPAEEWHQLSRRPEKDKQYSLLYFLSNPGVSPYAAKKYAQDNRMQVISMGFSPRDIRYGVNCKYSYGPQEFLGAIEGADVILTNSFHCTAFAIIMEKDFYVRKQKGKQARNDRMISLLKELGLEDRLYFDEEADQLDFDRRIDYRLVKEKLKKLICQSAEYLQSTVEDLG